MTTAPPEPEAATALQGFLDAMLVHLRQPLPAQVAVARERLLGTVGGRDLSGGGGGGGGAHGAGGGGGDHGAGGGGASAPGSPAESSPVGPAATAEGEAWWDILPRAVQDAGFLFPDGGGGMVLELDPAAPRTYCLY